MAKKYIYQTLFDYFVCFVALTSMVSEHSESELFDMGWKSYEADLIDDGIKEDVLRAVHLAKNMLEHNVLITGFGYPVVPQGTARLRAQISAAHTRNHLDRALEVFEMLKHQI